MLTNIMKLKHLIASAIGVALCASPFVSYAAYNDVTLQEGTAELSVGGVTLTLTTPGALLTSITVNTDSFEVTMDAQSYLKIQSADRRNITVTDYAPVKLTSSCTDSSSTNYFESPASAQTKTFTVTVANTTCTTGGTSGGSGSPGGSGGGGGGSSGGSANSGRAQRQYPDGTVVYLDEPGATAKIKELDAKFAVKTVSPVVAKTGTPATPSAQVTSVTARSAISGTVDRLLKKGMTNPGVKVLQQILNSDPDTQIATSGTGAPGNESTFFGPGTLKAIQKFQVKHGLAKPGDDGYGNVGPKTRAKLNEIAGGVSGVPATPSVAPAQVSATVITGSISSRSLSKGVKHAEVKTLQQVLNSDPDTQIANTGDGSPGNETTFFGAGTLKAIQKFQLKHGLAKPGDDGYGNVGPKTRAKLNEIASGVSANGAQGDLLQKQIEDALKQINILQDQLKKAQ